MPFFPWGLPALHVANRLITSGWTDWNATCVQRGAGLERPASLLATGLPPRGLPFSGWAPVCWAASGHSELGSGVKLQPFLEVKSAWRGGPVVIHFLVGKAWVTEKTCSQRASSAFWRRPKGLHLSYHCGKRISEEPGRGLPTCQAGLPPPAHESQLRVRR